MRQSFLFLSTFLCFASIAFAADHPLQPLSNQEIRDSVRIVKSYFAGHALPADRLLYPLVVLNEPPKTDVLNFLDSGGAMPPRRARVEVMHYPTNRVWIAIADLASNSVVSNVLQAAGTQSFVTATEFVTADTVIHNNAAWQAAIRARGIDPDLCYVDVWAPGDLPASGVLSHGANTRVLRAISYYRGFKKINNNPPQNPYDRPIEGLVVTLDMNAETIIGGKPVQGKVVDIIDSGIRPTPSESGNADQVRPALNALNMNEPQGPNFTRSLSDGRQIHWQNWDFYAVLHPREGLVLYDVRFGDRRIAYRLSASEAYVPYGINDNNWVWRTAFDIGEYSLATYAQALEPDHDVPNNSQFIDATLASDAGSPINYPNTIGIYERFDGFAWSRTDPTTGARDTRGSRALVVHWNAWIGNYIYGFDWTFRQDASLEVVFNATGLVVSRATASDDGEGTQDRSAPLLSISPVVPGSVAGADGRARVRAPNHQHFFNFRFDTDIDGTDNIAVTKDVVHVPAAEGGGENSFAELETTIGEEGSVDSNPGGVRSWAVESAHARNAVGEPTAYALELPALPPALSDATFAPLLRASFATKPFWVTRYKEGELYAAGDHPNQGHAGDGLPSYVADHDALNASSSGADIVVWFTIGFTHVPRPEDYPVMPTERMSFKFAPHGFFGRNPALDLAK